MFIGKFFTNMILPSFESEKMELVLPGCDVTCIVLLDDGLDLTDGDGAK